MGEGREGGRGGGKLSFVTWFSHFLRVGPTHLLPCLLADETSPLFVVPKHPRHHSPSLPLSAPPPSLHAGSLLPPPAGPRAPAACCRAVWSLLRAPCETWRGSWRLSRGFSRRPGGWPTYPLAARRRGTGGGRACSSECTRPRSTCHTLTPPPPPPPQQGTGSHIRPQAAVPFSQGAS